METFLFDEEYEEGKHGLYNDLEMETIPEVDTDDVNDIEDDIAYYSGLSRGIPTTTTNKGINIKKNTNNNNSNNNTVNSNTLGSSVGSNKIPVSVSFSVSSYISSRVEKRNLPRKPKVSNFEPLKVLGQGAYGKVLLVKERESGRLFAQKQLKKAAITVTTTADSEITQSLANLNIADNSDKKNSSNIDCNNSNNHNNKNNIEHENDNKIPSMTCATALTERNILESVRHPFIVKLFYALQDDTKLYLILEYAQGGELLTHLCEARMFPENVAAFYTAELVLALHHLHSVVGVVYRDLKPENCLLDKYGHLVLTDFGLSKVAVEDDENDPNGSKPNKKKFSIKNTTCSTITGTAEYMAPEILLGHEYTAVVDWWSLGAIAYDFLTGAPPFTGNNYKNIIDKITKSKCKPNMPYYMSPYAKDLLTKLLRKDPKKRLGSNEATDINVLKSHKFFRNVDFHLLETNHTLVIPPIVPIVTDPLLAENFSSSFTNMPIVSPPTSPQSVLNNQNFIDDINNTKNNTNNKNIKKKKKNAFAEALPFNKKLLQPTKQNPSSSDINSNSHHVHPDSPVLNKTSQIPIPISTNSSSNIINFPNFTFTASQSFLESALE